MTGSHVMPRGLDTCRRVQPLNLPDLVAQCQRYHQAGSAGPGGAAGPVQVVLVIIGRIEVHH
jgi:hypothetical protein